MRTSGSLRTTIIGSGNLTPGGLHRNFEAFSVMRSEAGETIDVTSWDHFLKEHAADLRSFDESVIEHAAQNVIRRPHVPDVEPDVVETSGRSVNVEPPVGAIDRFLVAQVPRAGDRWQRIHFNRDVIARFFRVRHGAAQRVFLVKCRLDGTLAEQEVRPCVHSDVNKNPRIEIGHIAGSRILMPGHPSPSTVSFKCARSPICC